MSLLLLGTNPLAGGPFVTLAPGMTNGRWAGIALWPIGHNVHPPRFIVTFTVFKGERLKKELRKKKLWTFGRRFRRSIIPTNEQSAIH
jgi:hypothetical protein